MKILDAGTSGENVFHSSLKISDLPLPVDWIKGLQKICPTDSLRPVQSKALLDFDILNSRKHLVVSSPTNSGKTLIGYLCLLDAVKKGKRAVLLEPLRALAQEKVEELNRIFSDLPKSFMARRPKVQITTGDYRLESEQFDDAPPTYGEIVVATPERLEAILRSPENDAWFQNIASVVLDEAHMIGDSKRGGCQEYLIASLLSFPSPPRIVLLSATLGEPEILEKWLTPCDLIFEPTRIPPLTKNIILVEDDDDINSLLVEQVKNISRDVKSSILIFVYKRSSCSAISSLINEHPDLSGMDISALPYHSGMNSAEKNRVRELFLKGNSRCVVSTTSLAMGVNLPATHTIILETTFWGAKTLSVGEILQMLGRAGRGSSPGHGFVFLRTKDKWDPEALKTALINEEIEPLKSSFEINQSFYFQRKNDGNKDKEQVAGIVAAVLARHQTSGASTGKISKILDNTLAGHSLTQQIPEALTWLDNNTLTYINEAGNYCLTKLGVNAVRSVLPLKHAAGIGQLFRDILEIDARDNFFSRWSPIDHLILLELLAEQSPKLKGLNSITDSLTEKVDGWFEGKKTNEKSVLFAEWIHGKPGYSKADQLLGSLEIAEKSTPNDWKDRARKLAYQAAFNAIIMTDLSNGKSISDIERSWGISELSGRQESWRDRTLWLLSGQLKTYALKCFYYHIKEECQADTERTQRIKSCFKKMQFQVYSLIEQIKYCSPLGGLLRGVRSMLKNSKNPNLGIQTIRRLEEGGISSIMEASQLSLDDFLKLGVQKSYAKQIRQYLKRRML
ncbi:DEAD/DEAH box helicase [Thermodesulfobacteriota bacterium]